MSVEGKVKVIQLENGKKKADVGWKVGLVNSTIEIICVKTEPKLLARLNRTDRE